MRTESGAGMSNDKEYGAGGAWAIGINPNAVDFTPFSGSGLDKPSVIHEALTVAGVAPTVIHQFTEATDLIVEKESIWDPNAVAAFGHERVMADGQPYPAQRGLTQLTPWAFAEYHVAGASNGIYDPVANISAAWRLVGAACGVDLHTGQGLDEFVAKIRAQPGTWFGELST